MKRKISVSIEEDTIEKLEGYVKTGSFRNKSHVIEFAIDKFMQGEKDEQTKR